MEWECWFTAVLVPVQNKGQASPASRAGQGLGRDMGETAEQAQASACMVDAEEQHGIKPT